MGQAQAVRFHWCHPDGHRLRGHVAAAQRRWGIYNFIYFLSWSLVFYLGLTIFSVPYVAMGYEISEDFHERTNIMAVAQFIGQWAWVVAPGSGSSSTTLHGSRKERARSEGPVHLGGHSLHPFCLDSGHLHQEQIHPRSG